MLRSITQSIQIRSNKPIYYLTDKLTKNQIIEINALFKRHKSDGESKDTSRIFPSTDPNTPLGKLDRTPKKDKSSKTDGNKPDHALEDPFARFKDNTNPKTGKPSIYKSSVYYCNFYIRVQVKLADPLGLNLQDMAIGNVKDVHQTSSHCFKIAVKQLLFL